MIENGAVLLIGVMANENDIIAVGIFYVMAAEENSIAKIRYYTDSSTEYLVTDFSIRKIHHHIVSLLEQPLLID